MNIPGPEHRITVTPPTGYITIAANGATIAASSNALELRDADNAPVALINYHVAHHPDRGDAIKESTR